MQRKTITQLPVSRATRNALVDDIGVDGAIGYRYPSAASGWRVVVFGPGCVHATLVDAVKACPHDPDWIWERAWVEPACMSESRTQAALDLLAAEPGLTPYAAAKRCNVHVSAVYRAQQRQQRPVCQCCGRALQS
jgi:hypothetical protein